MTYIVVWDELADEIVLEAWLNCTIGQALELFRKTYQTGYTFIIQESD